MAEIEFRRLPDDVLAYHASPKSRPPCMVDGCEATAEWEACGVALATCDDCRRELRRELEWSDPDRDDEAARPDDEGLECRHCGERVHVPGEVEGDPVWVHTGGTGDCRGALSSDEVRPVHPDDGRMDELPPADETWTSLVKRDARNRSGQTPEGEFTPADRLRQRRDALRRKLAAVEAALAEVEDETDG